MSEKKHHHHHHLFHRHEEEEKPVEVAVTYENTEAVSYGADDYEKEEKHHKRKEHLGEMGALAAGAFALYEKHEAKKDPVNKQRHKIEEEVAAAAAVGAGGYAFHEHHEKKEAKEEEERVCGKKKHHLF
ncbi:hypothetical protein C2S52_000606 [Perilla frutescens var. hirtella]|nr:hypothetical protein C2S52_000606 [Perilla frutescens var. hirtella]